MGKAACYKIMISAGESSGEIHGAALISEAARRGLSMEFFGLGGARMAAAGARILAHINDTAVMGFTETLGRLKGLLSIQERLKRSLELDRPQALVLIDFPDFNFGLARRATELGIPVIYYICPQVWAWRAGRLKFLARHTTRRALLFSFEKEFYEARGLSADWVGHPILDELPPRAPRPEMRAALGFAPDLPLLAILPGSRQKVAERLAPVLLGAAAILAAENPSLQLALPLADSISAEFIAQFVNAAPAAVRGKLRVIPNRSLEILAAAEAAAMASGTSSVEALFLGTPMAVAYKVSPLSWFLGKRLVSVPYVSIANILAGREILPEFLQDRARPENLAAALSPLINGGPAREQMLRDLAWVREKLGFAGASGRVLDIVLEEAERGGRRAL